MALMKKLLIVGYGDIARRAAPRLEARYAVQPLSRRHGFDLDRPETLAALQGADALLHCAPPPSTGTQDTRTRNLLAALAKGRILPARLVYVSTSGVYGDCGGARVNELRAVHPQNDRARRRVDAERQLALWCSERGVSLAILRVPGIYAADRLPLERLRAGTPVLRVEDDVYTNHSTRRTWRRSSCARWKRRHPPAPTTPATTARSAWATGWTWWLNVPAWRARRASHVRRRRGALRRSCLRS